MRLVLADITALDYWRRASAPALSPRFVGHAAIVPGDVSDQALPKRKGRVAIEPVSSTLLGELRDYGVLPETEAHILVTHARDRRWFSGVIQHVCELPLPAASFYPIYANGRRLEGLYVCNPALALAQLASRVSTGLLVTYGLEICGSFRTFGGETGYHCEALMEAKELASYVQRASYLHGTQSLSRATSWIKDGSASPAEAAIMTSLALPPRFGGMNLGMPQLNRTLELDAHASRLLGWSSLTPDGLWRHRQPGKPGFPLEYDSATYHSEREQIERDERRRNAYASLGMGVAVVRPRHLKDDLLIDAVGETVRRNIGARPFKPPKGYDELHRALLSELFGFWRRDSAKDVWSLE